MTPPMPSALRSQRQTPHAPNRAMAVGMALSAAVHLCLLMGMSLWKERERPPVVYAVTLASPPALAHAPSVAVKAPVSRSAPPVPPPAADPVPEPDDPNSMQAWWEKQARLLRKKRMPQAKLPPPKVEKTKTNPTPNTAVSTPTAATPAPTQATPGVDAPTNAPTNAIVQTGISDADRQAFLEHPSYFSRVQNKIDRQWVATRSRGDAASAIVLFSIEKNGTIRAVQMEQPSGDWLFDQAALRAIHEASPLPPLPPGLMTQVVHYRFTSQADKTP